MSDKKETKVIKLQDGVSPSIFAGFVVLDFYADWCIPCKPVAVQLEKLAEEFTNVKFYKVNVDDSPSLASYFGISNLPTVYVLYGSEVRHAIFSKFDTEIRKALRNAK